MPVSKAARYAGPAELKNVDRFVAGLDITQKTENLNRTTCFSGVS
jgi:hypothetical protein